MSIARSLGVAVCCGGVYAVGLNAAVKWEIGSTPSTAGALPPGFQLKSAQVVFRHGARTPIQPWRLGQQKGEENAVAWSELLPEKEDSSDRIPVTLYRASGERIGPLRWGKSTWKLSNTVVSGHPSGELTEVGYQQAVALGKRLRERYHVANSLLSDTYSSKHVYARSTGFNRTQQTAQGVLTGLFGAEKPQEEVVLHILPWQEEVLVANSRICQLYRTLYDHVYVSRFGESTAAARRKVIEQLKLRRDEVHFVFLRDVIIARMAHGKSIPVGITGDLWQAIDDAAAKAFSEPFRKPDRVPALQVGCGVMLHSLLENFQTADDNNASKLYLYSAHDSLICPLLEAIGAYDHVWPPFASDVTFELYENPSKEKIVRVSYNDKVVVVDGCDDVNCPLERFTASMQRFAVSKDQYPKLCGAIDPLRPVGRQSEKGDLTTE